MSDWVEEKLGQLATIEIGGTPSRDVPAFWASEGTSGHPWVSIADLGPKYVNTTKEQITDIGVRSSNVKHVESGTMLMSFKLTIGRAGIAACNLFTNEAIAAIIPEKRRLDSGFLYYLLPPIARSSVTDTAIKGITLNKQKLARLRLRFPKDIKQQRRIAEILSTLDEAIEQTEALIAKMQQVKAGLMHDLFTCGVTPDCRLRPTREQAPELYKVSPIGWIPREWDVCPAEKICYMITKGATPAQLLNQDDPSAVPFIRVQNLTFDGSLLFDEDQSFIPLSVSSGELARSRVLPGDVLMNIVGPPLGKISVIPDTYLEWNINQAIAIFRPIDPSASKYLSFFLLSNIAQDWFLGRAKRTSGQVNLTLEMCRQLPIPIPRDIKELKNITCLFASVDDLTKAEKNSLNKLKEQKEGIMHDLLTGYVRV